MNWKLNFIFKFKQVSATFIRTSRTYCILRCLFLSVTGALTINPPMVFFPPKYGTIPLFVQRKLNVNFKLRMSTTDPNSWGYLDSF